MLLDVGDISEIQKCALKYERFTFRRPVRSLVINDIHFNRGMNLNKFYQKQTNVTATDDLLLLH